MTRFSERALQCLKEKGRENTRRHLEQIGKIWTDEEVTFLQEVYPSTDYSFNEIIQSLPKRTDNAVRFKARRLGLRRPIPTKESHGCCSHCGQTSKEATS